MDRNVFLMALPPNTTHVLQPLDVGVFAQFKKAAHHAIDDLSLEGQKPLLKHNIGRVLQAVWEKTVTMSNIQIGFRKSGIWPINERAVLDSRLSQTAATITASHSAMDIDAAPNVPPVGPLHLFADAILGPDVAQPSFGSVHSAALLFQQQTPAQQQATISAASPAGQTNEDRLRIAVSGHLAPISMAALVSGKTVELALLPEHLHGVLTLPYAANGGSSDSKDSKDSKENKDGKGKQKKSRKLPPKAVLLTSKGFIAKLQEKADEKSKEKEAKEQRKQDRAKKKQKKDEEKAEKAKAKAEQKQKHAEEKAKAKGKAKPKQKPSAKPKAAAKRKASAKTKAAAKGKDVDGKDEAPGDAGGDGREAKEAKDRPKRSAKRRRADSRSASESDSASDSGSDSEAADTESSESDSELIASNKPFRKGFAIVQLEPEPTDPRPFGLGHINRDYARALKPKTPVAIDVWLPDDRKNLLQSRYSQALVKGEQLHTTILAGQISAHSFELKDSRLPDEVRADTADLFDTELREYRA